MWHQLPGCRWDGRRPFITGKMAGSWGGRAEGILIDQVNTCRKRKESTVVSPPPLPPQTDPPKDQGEMLGESPGGERWRCRSGRLAGGPGDSDCGGGGGRCFDSSAAPPPHLSGTQHPGIPAQHVHAGVHGVHVVAASRTFILLFCFFQEPNFNCDGSKFLLGDTDADCHH